MLKRLIASVLVVLLAVNIISVEYVSAAEDAVERIGVDYLYGYVEWDSTIGPYYRVDMNTGEVLDCTSEEAKVIAYSLEGDVFFVTVYSKELPEEKTYALNLKEAKVLRGEDYITDSYVDEALNYFTFDTFYGPDYHVDITTGELRHCSSDDLYPDKPKAKF